MTGRELIEYVQQHHLEDCMIGILCRDNSGYYFGSDSEPILCKIEALEDGRSTYTVPFDKLIL